MKLECVQTCVGYGDFLAETLPLNRHLFDKLVVVTSHDDKATQKVCEFYHTKCITTPAFNTHLGQFCKGRGINVGLDSLDRDGWLLQMDSDIVLPPLTRVILEKLGLDQSMVYGFDRFMVPSYSAWRQFMSAPKLGMENETWTHLDAFPLGVRVSRGHMFTPIGFMQLWHSAVAKSYPEGHTTAAREDMLFAEQWPRTKRGFVPEVVPYHLESEATGAMGTNWQGRTTAPFGPAVAPPSLRRAVAPEY